MSIERISFAGAPFYPHPHSLRSYCPLPARPVLSPVEGERDSACPVLDTGVRVKLQGRDGPNATANCSSTLSSTKVYHLLDSVDPNS